MRSKPSIDFLCFFIFSLSLFLSFSTFAQSNNSKTLAECEFIYSYAAQTMQIQNNNGAAVNLIRRSSVVTTANFFINQKDNVINKETLDIWQDLRSTLRQKIISEATTLEEELIKCDKTAIPISSQIRVNSKNLWGKNFDEIQKHLFDQYKITLGL